MNDEPDELRARPAGGRPTGPAGGPGSTLPGHGAAFRDWLKARGAPYRRVQVIVNPASGRNRPILNVLNDVLEDAGIDWDVAVTRRGVSPRDLVRRAIERGVDLVAVYGGDGTVMDAAYALAATDVPLAILPGGTSNALAISLAVPMDLGEACRLIVRGDSEERAIDVGRLDDTCFLVALGIGIPGMWAVAEREEKDRFGSLAYLVRSLQAVGKATPSRYTLALDGATVETTGVACIIANTGGFGLGGLSLAPTIVMDDGLLDVIVIHDTDIATILSLAASVLQLDDAAPQVPRRTVAEPAGTSGTAAGTMRLTAPLEHWQVRRVNVVADPPQAVQADGEVLQMGPVRVSVAPQALRILVPV